MKWYPNPIAVALCQLWLACLILFACWGLLSGSASATAHYPFAAGVSLVALLLMERVVLMSRWAFAIIGVLALASAFTEWILPLSFADERIVTISGLIAAAAAIIAFSGKRESPDLNPVGKVALRTALLGGLTAVAIAASAFYNSFRVKESFGMKLAEFHEVTGPWFGTRPTNVPKMHPTRLTLLSDGTGEFKDGITVTKLRWLMRGHALHVSLLDGQGDDLNLCPELANDKHAVYFGRPGLLGVEFFKRDPYDVKKQKGVIE